MMAARQINYASIFGSYVMKTQFEIAKAREEERTKDADTNAAKHAILQETVEDYIEQA